MQPRGFFRPKIKAPKESDAAVATNGAEPAPRRKSRIAAATAAAQAAVPNAAANLPSGSVVRARQKQAVREANGNGSHMPAGREAAAPIPLPQPPQPPFSSLPPLPPLPSSLAMAQPAPGLSSPQFEVPPPSVRPTANGGPIVPPAGVRAGPEVQGGGDSGVNGGANPFADALSRAISAPPVARLPGMARPLNGPPPPAVPAPAGPVPLPTAQPMMAPTQPARPLPPIGAPTAPPDFSALPPGIAASLARLAGAPLTTQSAQPSQENKTPPGAPSSNASTPAGARET